MSKKESRLEIVDTYPNFLTCWNAAGVLSIKEKLQKWKAEYMKKYPALLQKQVKDYDSRGFNWKEEAKENVFPYLEERLPDMEEARKHLLDVLPAVYDQACSFFKLNPEIITYIYVGIGCGAGWSTSLENKPALLFGLENIAESGWSDKRSIEGLVAHECGHSFHEIIRENANLPLKEGPFWRLYKEGVAKWSEFKLLNRESWYEVEGLNDPEWLHWCRENLDWLAEEFLRRVEKEEPVKEFFGSWYDLKGWKQTGYFLGYSAVTHLQEGGSLSNTNVLKLSNPADKMKQVLEKLARKR